MFPELSTRLKEYQDRLDSLQEAVDAARSQNRVRELEEKLRQMEHEIAEAVRLRDAALENERQMAMKYRELDVFKLDVIARELKKLDKELEALRRDPATQRSLVCVMMRSHAVAPHLADILQRNIEPEWCAEQQG